LVVRIRNIQRVSVNRNAARVIEVTVIRTSHASYADGIQIGSTAVEDLNAMVAAVVPYSSIGDIDIAGAVKGDVDGIFELVIP